MASITAMMSPALTVSPGATSSFQTLPPKGASTSSAPSGTSMAAARRRLGPVGQVGDAVELAAALPFGALFGERGLAARFERGDRLRILGEKSAIVGQAEFGLLDLDRCGGR
jgi:hypothetical protein